MAKFWENLKRHEDVTEKHKITKEEILFLKHLQQEMNTQDTVGQADPRYWVIRDYKKVYGKELNSPDGISIYDPNTCNTIIEIAYEFCNADGVAEKIITELEEDEYELNEDEIESLKTAYDISSLVEKLNEIETYEFSISEYQEIPMDCGFFFTHEAAEDHLKRNAHHYADNAHTYAHTSWRNKEEKLWQILQNVDFDSLK